jgi:hypothetical protein
MLHACTRKRQHEVFLIIAIPPNPTDSSTK